MFVIKSISVLLLAGSLLLVAPTGCQTSSVVDPITPTGTLISSSLISDIPAAQVRSSYKGVNAVPQSLLLNGVRTYRLEYSTTNTDGTRIKASGAVIIPAIVTKDMPMLSMQHGTIQGSNDAPSNFGPGSDVYKFGPMFASQGYITVAPDYIGYGASENVPHPYEHRNSLATASLDMLRATRDFLTQNRVSWDKRVFLTGYSEGGYATMALQKKIEEETSNEFKLVASSCGAGAYDKPAFMRQILNERTAGDAGTNHLYLWVLLTYDRIYGLNRPMTYYFKEPYASQVAAAGKNANINVSLNTTFTDRFKKGVNDGTDTAFLRAMQDNDIHDWKPRTPTQLYHGDADQTVLYLNSKNTYIAMQKRGATNVKLMTLRGANHGSAAPGYIVGTNLFFGAIQ